jgi:CheY-like chemotaxis protein
MSTATSKSVPATRPATPERARTILIVDDDLDLVRSIQAFLEGRGYVVLTAGNGTHARELLAAVRPDLIVLDVMMDTDTEGLDLAYALNLDERLRRVPVVLLTGFTQHLETGRFDFILGRDWPGAKLLEKPVALPALAGTIERLIAERAALDHAAAAEELRP